MYNTRSQFITEGRFVYNFTDNERRNEWWGIERRLITSWNFQSYKLKHEKVNGSHWDTNYMALLPFVLIEVEHSSKTVLWRKEILLLTIWKAFASFGIHVS